MSDSMKSSILKLVKDYGDVSFVELSAKIEGFKGDNTILSPHFDSHVFWIGVSEEGLNSINSLLSDKKVSFVCVSDMVYAMDGGRLGLELVKRNMEYKSKRWQPVVLRYNETG